MARHSHDSMSVADSAAAEPQPVKPKRILRPLTDLQWRQARVMFETAGLDVTQADIAKAFDTSLSSVQKRSAAEKWSKGAQVVADARKHLATAVDSAMAKAADSAAQQIAERTMRDLQPWIEKQKRDQIQRAIKRSKRAHKRLDRVAKGYQVFDAKKGEIVDLETSPKDEMHIAAAEDKYDNIIRRNLGMSDGNAFSGQLSSGILVNQAVIQVSQK
jgi:hypothetical protein